MIENYASVLNLVGDDHIVRVNCFDDCQPISVFSECKTKKSGLFKTRKLKREERAEVFSQTKGVAFVCPMSEVLGSGTGQDAETQILLQGLAGLTLARVFDNTIIGSQTARYCDCILAPNGTLIYRSEPREIENQEDEILSHFQEAPLPAGGGWGIVKNGYWVFGLGGEAFTDKGKLEKVYDGIACWLAEKSVQECGVQQGEHEFETAKQIPAELFKADPKFVDRILAEAGEIICNKKLKKEKEHHKSQINAIVTTGLRLSDELKKIFQQKLDEAEKLPEFSLYCTEPEKRFPKGTFTFKTARGTETGTQDGTSQPLPQDKNPRTKQ